MGAQASLIPELEDVVRHGSAARRADAVRRIADLFIDGASRFSEEHVSLFDDVLIRIIGAIEAQALRELSRRLAPIPNAPVNVVNRLANDDDIDIAWPVLRRSPRLDDPALVSIARTKGQQHLLAIAGRPSIAEAVTDILVDRGDHEVVRNVARNRGARLSKTGFTEIVRRAEADGGLAELIGLRPEIPPHLFRHLVLRATDTVRNRLLASAQPETKAEIRRVLDMISAELNSEAKPRDYSAAMRVIIELRDAGKLSGDSIAASAQQGQFEQTVAGLSALCGVPIDVVERLISGDHVDPVLILCRSIGLPWPTARAVLGVRPNHRALSSSSLDEAFANFERLSRPTAQRVVRFWQARPATADAPR